MITLQVTIGAGNTQVTTSDIPVRQVIFQNNTANVCRVGDVNVSATRGALLASGSPGGSVNFGPFRDHADNLKNYWIQGTQNGVIDVTYIP